MSINLKKLADCRDTLLLLEVFTWLHMFGKFHEDFLKGNNDLDINIPPEIKNNYKELYTLLVNTWPQQIWQNLNVTELNLDKITIENIIKGHRSNAEPGFGSLIKEVHGRGSSIEKSVVRQKGSSLYDLSKQTNTVYLSTVFGMEKGAINLNAIKDKKKELYKFLQDTLDSLKKTNAKPPTGWVKFRKIFIQKTREFFTLTVGDTRHPINDITLFNQTVVSVAFLKAALAKIILSGWKDPANKKEKYNWRLLRVGLDHIAFFNRSLSIADVEARQELIETGLNKIRNLLEIQYPIGYEIYRDENGSVFIVPDIEKILDGSINNNTTLKEKIQKIFLQRLNQEAELSLLPISKATRNMLTFGKLAKEELAEPSPQPEWLVKQWNGIKSRQICPVCGYRPQVNKERALCDICKDRRQDRAKKWLKNLDTTIWIDEIADENGKVALITGQFNLLYWLSGEVISSITVVEPSKKYINYLSLKNEIINNFDKDIKQINYLYQLLPGYIKKEFKTVKDLYNFLVEDSDLKTNVNTANNIKAKLLLLSLIRQQPSPARIHRVWETTKKFWEDINSNFKNIITNPLRLVLIPKNTLDINNLIHANAYELFLNDKKISVFWNEINKHFILIENHKYIEKSQKLEKSLRNFLEDYNGKITVQEPSDYGKKVKPLGSFIPGKVEEKFSYSPAIPILSEPSAFMALVPADKALDIINSIKEKYEKEMGKVRNRLPLHLGVVFSHCKTPLRVILDSGRRMLKERKTHNIWEIKDKKDTSDVIQDNHFKECRKIDLIPYKNQNNKEKERTISWHVPLKMGDGITDDEWYPYVFVKSDKDDKKPLDRNRLFEAPCPWNNNEPEWVVHTKELNQGDKIYFTPSTLDYQWIDTGGRRFEIAYDENGQRFDMPRRPYLLDEFDKLQKIWNTLEKHLTTTQIHALRELIETKRNEWDISENDLVFRQFCRDAISMAQWKKREDNYPWGDKEKPDKKWIDTWADYAVNGWLKDVIEINMQILKRKPE